jgi:hypothetical protein
MTSLRRQKAQVLADTIIASVPSVEAICLFGSVARGADDEWSDIDLLVVGSNPELTPTGILRRLPERVKPDRLSLLYYPSTNLTQLYDQGDLFVAHLRREGAILYDKSGVLERTLHGPFQPRMSLKAEVEIELERLRLYSRLERFNDNFLFCLSDLYAIGKSVVMLGLAKDGVFEFDRDRAFARFRQLHPDKRSETDVVAGLRPFYRVVTKRAPDSLPFPYIGASNQTRAAVRAVRSLAEVVLGDDGEAADRTIAV